MYFKRDFVTYYKQTVLGPLWFIIQPLLTTLVYVFVFGGIAKISTGGIPNILFYLSGITLWNLFSEILVKCSTVFKDNQHIFGKVYFPRIVVPFSIMMTVGLKFLIQVVLLGGVLIYFAANDYELSLSFEIFIVPIIVIFTGMLSLGTGMLLSSLTIRYRDLVFLIQFAVQLLMFATPIIYPLDIVSGNQLTILHLNPMTHAVEAFRSTIVGASIIDYQGVLYFLSVSFGVFLLGVVVFNRTERSFMDSI
jgi:lipopolysaccharide transport system permease protein